MSVTATSISYRRAVILANSWKHAPGRCIAGREIAYSAHSLGTPGNWIRPVSNFGEGELYANHCLTSDGGPIALLDIFDIPVIAKCTDPLQPENWLVASGIAWQRVSTWPSASLNVLLETPAGLWPQSGCRPDRVTSAHLRGNPPAQSIYLIPLETCSILPDGWSAGRYRLWFTYTGGPYNLKITDPAIAPSTALGGTSPIAATISLAPEFNGHHFKLVAAIFR